jgi:hypothetical protein
MRHPGLSPRRRVGELRAENECRPMWRPLPRWQRTARLFVVADDVNGSFARGRRTRLAPEDARTNRARPASVASPRRCLFDVTRFTLLPVVGVYGVLAQRKPVSQGRYPGCTLGGPWGEGFDEGSAQEPPPLNRPAGVPTVKTVASVRLGEKPQAQKALERCL